MRNGATRFNGGQDELLDAARKLFAERICCKSAVLSPLPTPVCACVDTVCQRAVYITTFSFFRAAGVQGMAPAAPLKNTSNTLFKILLEVFAI